MHQRLVPQGRRRSLTNDSSTFFYSLVPQEVADLGDDLLGILYEHLMPAWLDYMEGEVRAGVHPSGVLLAAFLLALDRAEARQSARCVPPHMRLTCGLPHANTRALRAPCLPCLPAGLCLRWPRFLVVAGAAGPVHG